MDVQQFVLCWNNIYFHCISFRVSRVYNLLKKRNSCNVPAVWARQTVFSRRCSNGQMFAWDLPPVILFFVGQGCVQKDLILARCFCSLLFPWVRVLWLKAFACCVRLHSGRERCCGASLLWFRMGCHLVKVGHTSSDCNADEKSRSLHKVHATLPASCRHWGFRVQVSRALPIACASAEWNLWYPHCKYLRDKGNKLYEITWVFVYTNAITSNFFSILLCNAILSMCTCICEFVQKYLVGTNQCFYMQGERERGGVMRGKGKKNLADTENHC